MLHATRQSLSNGIRVLYITMPAFHSAIATLYLRMGPRFETLAENGISHFVEHVLFKGTRRHPDPEALSRAIDACGAELNGATMPEYTELVAGAHTRYFLDALSLLAEVALEPLFDPDHVETERQVILEEMGQSRDVPGDGVTVDELTHELMWPGHAHEFQCLGPEENIRSLSAERLAAHYRRFLKGANVVICVAGNFPHDEVAALLAETFGRLERGAPVAAPLLHDAQNAPRQRFKWAPSRMAYVRLCHKACSYRDQRVYPLVVLSELLGGGATSRLFSRLRERDGLVYDVYSGTTLFCDCGWLEVSTTTSRGKVAATIEAALEETRKIAEEGPPEEQLQSIKERVACNMEILEDNPPELAEWMGVRELLLAPDEVLTPGGEAERLKEVTADEVRRVAREVFQPQRRSLVVLGPCPWPQRRRIRRLLVI